MKILTRENVVLFSGEIEKGVFPEADPTRELYRINSSNYSVTDEIMEFEVTNIPSDFIQNKYCYTKEKGFYLNPEYSEPEKSLEEQLKEANERIDNLIAQLK